MFINNTPLYIGTSGYNHEDWKGTFAPVDIHNFDLLTFYADKGLNFLEVAFTFYRMPERDKIQQIINRAGNRMKFSVRVPKTLIRNPGDTEECSLFLKGIAPMLETGTLSCLYADYHPSFSASRKNQDLILLLRNNFKEVPFFAELVNRTWYKERIFEYFKEHGIGMTIIDMPRIQGFAPYYPVITNGALYFKLYGRSPLWLTAGEKILDYSYSDETMAGFLNDAANKSIMASDIFMVFANVGKGKAAFNALSMGKLADG